jgi:hypothetical protein
MALTRRFRSDPANDCQTATGLAGNRRLENEDERRACLRHAAGSPEHTDLMALMFPGALGMAAGGWLASELHGAYGFYAPAFIAGTPFNVMNLLLIGVLVTPRTAMV